MMMGREERRKERKEKGVVVVVVSDMTRSTEKEDKIQPSRFGSEANGQIHIGYSLERFSVAFLPFLLGYYT